MAIKSIVEFTVQPGRRDEFVSLVESLVAQHMSSMREAGCMATTFYAVVDDPDRVVEIADWESAEARDAMTHSEASLDRKRDDTEHNDEKPKKGIVGRHGKSPRPNH